MGEFAKKWIAGIVAAVIVVVIVAIAIGRMDKKTTLKSTTSNNAAQKVAPPAAVVPPQTAAVAIPSFASSDAKSAEIRNEVVEPATPRKAAAKFGKPQHIVASRIQPGTQALSVGANNSASSQSAPTRLATQSSGQSQTQVSQAQPPVSPPDVATQPVQQLAQPNAEAQAKVVNLTAGDMKTTAHVDLDGVFINETSLVRENSKIATPPQNGALVTATGNAITLSPNSQFTAQPNSFLLDGGASNVNTATGMAARVKEYTITPVDPQSGTHYEVNWERDGVYVYARKLDVYIDGPCHFRKKLEQGQVARIPDPKRCGVIWFRNWPYAVAFGGAVGTGVGVVYYVTRPMSGSYP